MEAGTTASIFMGLTMWYNIWVMPKTSSKKLHKADQFHVVEDEKLRLATMALADKYDQRAREIIYRAYTDPELMNTYKAIRASGIHNRTGRIKGAGHHKILEFPNREVADFVNTNMTALYGPEWLQNNKAIQHELVKPWHVVDKI